MTIEEESWKTLVSRSVMPVGEGSVELVGHPNQSAATGGQEGLEDFSQAGGGAESGKEQERPSG